MEKVVIQREFKKIIRAILLSLPMGLLILVMITRLDFTNPELNLVNLIVYALVNSFFFLMIYTGKVDRYRSILFVTSTVAFSVSFIWNLYLSRGHFMILTDEDIASCVVPFCHIGIPQTLITAVFKQEFNFPGAFSGSMYTIPIMFAIWFLVTVVLGRGWCSWVCFFGGWEDGCSRILKKPALKIAPKKLLLLPFAVLLAAALISAVTLSPQYCWWLCPFKTVSEFPEPSSAVRIMQLLIMAVLFIGLVIVLPLLTKRRMQCALLCPFGAMQSLTNKISPFELRIDREKCSGCSQCIQLCPVFALDETSLKKGSPKIICLKCGKCADHCRENAIQYHIKGTKVDLKPGFAKMIFLYTSGIFLTAMGGGFIKDLFYKIILIVKDLMVV